MASSLRSSGLRPSVSRCLFTSVVDAGMVCEQGGIGTDYVSSMMVAEGGKRNKIRRKWQDGDRLGRAVRESRLEPGRLYVLCVICNAA